MNSPRQALDLFYCIRWKTPWHVGSGFRTTHIDRLVRRRRLVEADSLSPGGPIPEVPFVPGSQIKGVLRHRVEQLASTWQGRVIDPHSTGLENPELMAAFRPLSHCESLVDRLFGTRYQGDCLYVSDALSGTSDESPAPQEHRGKPIEGKTPPVTNTAENPQKPFIGFSAVDAWAQPRVGMDRATGTAKEGQLFVTERADFAQELQGQIRARHPAGVLTQGEEIPFPFEYSLLVAALLSLNTLGGDTSAGSGWCEIHLTEPGLVWQNADENAKPLTREQALHSFQVWGEMWHDWLIELRGQLPKEPPA